MHFLHEILILYAFFFTQNINLKYIFFYIKKTILATPGPDTDFHTPITVYNMYL